jgi:hypothetical protein
MPDSTYGRAKIIVFTETGSTSLSQPSVKSRASSSTDLTNLPCLGYETLLDPLNSATYAVSGRSMHS